MRVAGADPGKTGAFALLVDGELIDVRDMPTIVEIVAGKPRNKPTPALMAALFAEWQKGGPFCLYIERVSAFPKDSKVGAFSFGKGAGHIEGVAAGMGIPFTLVQPQVWKKATGTPTDKNAARARACQLFPSMAAHFARVRDDGRAEASILALFGHRALEGMMR